MARKRIPDEPVLKSWEECNLHLKEIAENELAIELIENDLNKQITDLKLDAELQAEVHKKKIDKLAKELKQFVELNRSDIKGKTMDLTFGKTGFRLSTKIVYKNAKAVVAALRARKMTDCIKTTETIIKDKLKTYSDAIIAAVGAGKKTEDTFWYETDREKLKANGTS